MFVGIRIGLGWTLLLVPILRTGWESNALLFQVCAGARASPDPLALVKKEKKKGVFGCGTARAQPAGESAQDTGRVAEATPILTD